MLFSNYCPYLKVVVRFESNSAIHVRQIYKHTCSVKYTVSSVTRSVDSIVRSILFTIKLMGHPSKTSFVSSIRGNGHFNACVFSQRRLMTSEEHTEYCTILTTTIKSGSWKMMCGTKQDIKWFLMGHKNGFYHYRVLRGEFIWSSKCFFLKILKNK